MLNTEVPSKFRIPFASAAGTPYLRTIPQLSQIAVTPGAASLTDGFPPLNFVPLASGGIPPSGQDLNGILLQITEWLRWQAAGAGVMYDAGFQTAVGGYPLGAIVLSATAPTTIRWRSLVDQNTTNPDTDGAGWILAERIRVSGGTLNLFVNPSGVDTADGLTVNTPVRTISRAITLAATMFELAGITVEINLAHGTYTGFYLSGTYVNSAAISIIGDTSSPQSVVIDGGITDATAFFAAQCTVSGVTIQSSGNLSSGVGIVAVQSSIVTIGTSVVFGVCGGAHISTYSNSSVSSSTGYSVTGAAPIHIYGAGAGGVTTVGCTIVVVGNPAFPSGWASVSEGACYQCWNTNFNGAATGARYSVTSNAVISTQGSGASYLPGSTAGVSATGGQYI